MQQYKASCMTVSSISKNISMSETDYIIVYCDNFVNWLNAKTEIK